MNSLYLNGIVFTHIRSKVVDSTQIQYYKNIYCIQPGNYNSLIQHIEKGKYEFTKRNNIIIFLRSDTVIYNVYKIKYRKNTMYIRSNTENKQCIISNKIREKH